VRRNCYNCKKELKKSESSHLRKCVKDISYENARYNQLIYDFHDFDLTKNNFTQLYKEGHSLIDFMNFFGLAYKQTNFLINYYKIKKRNKKEIAIIKKQKYKKTCIEKYGKEHSTTPEVIEKIKKNM